MSGHGVAGLALARGKAPSGRPIIRDQPLASHSQFNAKDGPDGRGYTQFWRVLFQQNIDILCASSSKAKGRVERMNGMLQAGSSRNCRWAAFTPLTSANAFAASFTDPGKPRWTS